MRFFQFLKTSFFFRLLIFMLAVLFIPLIILVVNTQGAADASIQKQVSRINEQVVGQLMERIELTMIQLQDLGNQYGSFPTVLSSLTSTGSAYEDSVQTNYLSATLDIAASVFHNDGDLGLFRLRNEGLTTSSNVSYEDRERFSKVASNFLKSGKSWRYMNENVDNSGRSYYLRRIPFDTWQEAKGILIISIKNSLYRNLIQRVETDNKGFFTLVNAQGSLISSTNPLSIKDAHSSAQALLERWKQLGQSSQFLFNERLVLIKQSKQYDQVIVISEIPAEVLTEDTRRIRQFVQYWAVLLAIAGFISVLGFAFYLYRPLLAVRRHIERIKQGHFAPVKVAPAPREIGELSHTLNAMSVHMQTLLSDLKLSEELKRRTEIKALQSQINPHFLYNSLNTILVYTIMGDYDKIKSLMGSLLSLLRYSMEHFEQHVPLEQEIAYIDDYLHMLELRYERAFVLETEIDEGLEELLVPKLLLQPLVENAVFHGILPLKELNGKLILRVARITEGDQISISLTDNGKGINEFELAQLRMGLLLEATGMHIGIRNVWDRIRLVYGPEAEYEFTSSIDRGTTFLFRFNNKLD
ncbi:HAMP domain-containing protein [Paenibacillus psychroresistens]|uniref:HAMP domain-containing protein n=1 Tax=Paenibacillus psychroresistens TaxID=1778678 RepID=A0A6B8RSB9_9BACL|nr:histidine kinase [Paenibacillus psychroresistens]QGQ98435.1 HAMP domain-containing protein [Paenibacillus psychroresistens]